MLCRAVFLEDLALARPTKSVSIDDAASDLDAKDICRSFDMRLSVSICIMLPVSSNSGIIRSFNTWISVAKICALPWEVNFNAKTLKRMV